MCGDMVVVKRKRDMGRKRGKIKKIKKKQTEK